MIALKTGPRRSSRPDAFIDSCQQKWWFRSGKENTKEEIGRFIWNIEEFTRILFVLAPS